MSQKITAILMLEMMGRPKEHLVETLEGFVKQIDSEKNVTVTNSKIQEPALVKDKEDLFTTFAEIEVEVAEFGNLAMLMFKYMPAHVEVIEPEKLEVGNNIASEVLSEITRRLHKYEELTRLMQMEMQVAKKQIDKLKEEKN
jgi:hypothetical protein